MFVPSPEQIWGIILFVFGNVILNWCIKVERDEFGRFKHRKILSRSGISLADVPTPGSKIRKIVMTLVGFLTALLGIYLFFKCFNFM